MGQISDSKANKKLAYSDIFKIVLKCPREAEIYVTSGDLYFEEYNEFVRLAANSEMIRRATRVLQKKERREDFIKEFGGDGKRVLELLK